MKKTHMVIIGLLALCSLIVIMNSASAVGIDLGSQKKFGDGTTADKIFVDAGECTIEDIYDDGDIDGTILQEITDKKQYLLNCSIQVNKSGVLKIDSDSCDWLMLASNDSKIANITCYGRLFINASLVTAVNWMPGGSDNYVNDTTYATGARSRPSIVCNSSGDDAQSIMSMAGARIAYLGSNHNESTGGVVVNDTGGSPALALDNVHISYCYNGLFIKSIITATTQDQLNVTNNLVFGIKIDSDSAVNFTNTNSTYNGACDWYTHYDVTSTINNTGGLGSKTLIYTGATGEINNVTQKFRTVSRTRGDTAWNLTARDIRFSTSDNDYVNINMSDTQFVNQEFTGETLDADFLKIVWPGMPRTNYYQLIVDDAFYTYANPDGDHLLTLNYSGSWSTKTFDIESYTPPGTGGGGGGTDPDLKTYYKRVNGEVVSAQFKDAPAGWSLTRPNCGGSSTTVGDSTGGGVDVYDYEVDDYLFFGALFIAALVGAILAFVPQAKTIVKMNKSTKNGILVIIAIIIIAMLLGWLVF